MVGGSICFSHVSDLKFRGFVLRLRSARWIWSILFCDLLSVAEELESGESEKCASKEDHATDHEAIASLSTFPKFLGETRRSDSRFRALRGIGVGIGSR